MNRFASVWAVAVIVVAEAWMASAAEPEHPAMPPWAQARDPDETLRTP